MENKNEFVDIKINKEIYDILKLWNKERKNEIKEKNFGTREPIYKVQSRTYISAHEDFGYDKVELVINIGGDYSSFKNLEEIKEYYNEDYFGTIKKYEDFKKIVDDSKNIYELPDKF